VKGIEEVMKELRSFLACYEAGEERAQLARLMLIRLPLWEIGLNVTARKGEIQ